MKQILLAALMLCSWVDLLAQSDENTYHWVSHLHGRGQETGYEMLPQSNGALLVLGTFSDSIIFFPDTVVVPQDPSAEPQDRSVGYFLAKYDSCGSLLWHRIWRATTYLHEIIGMEQDQQGRIYVAINDLDSLIIEGQQLTTNSGNAVIQLDSTGNFLSYFDPIGQVQGSAKPYLLDLAVSTNGEIALTGFIAVNPSSGVEPGYVEIGQERLEIAFDSVKGYYQSQAWLGVYTSEGQASWVRMTYAPSGAESRTVAFDPQGRVYWAGNFQAAAPQYQADIYVGSGNDSLSVDVGPSGFLMAYDPQGGTRWLQAFEVSPIPPDSLGEIRLWELEISPSGAIYLVGRLSDRVWVDSMQIPQAGVPFPPQGPIWTSIIKLSPAGEALWSRE
ncbi:MAG: hypothetical protein AAF399_22300, partial [Bacteroidota bacterium]